jgi:predicted amidophosphoribosyltransferase
MPTEIIMGGCDGFSYHSCNTIPVNGTDLFLAGMLLALVLLMLLAWKLLRPRKDLAAEAIEEAPLEKDMQERDQSVTCQICLGEVGAGCEYRVCDCGKSFHPVCISRTGFCPYCGASYIERDFRAERAAGQPKESDDICPVCGRAVVGKACECGALFPDEAGEMECPTCGSSVHTGQESCPRCGESFEVFVPRLCPVCEAVIHEGQGICRCGLVLDDLCPECGWKLGSREQTCPICGLHFEMVERDGLF